MPNNLLDSALSKSWPWHAVPRPKLNVESFRIAFGAPRTQQKLLVLFAGKTRRSSVLLIVTVSLLFSISHSYVICVYAYSVLRDALVSGGRTLLQAKGL